MSNFTRHSDIMQAMPVERQERIRAKAQALQAQINLVNLRKRQKTTQRELAERLHVSQSNISQLEQRGDMPLSSVLEYLHAMGATLDMQAVLPDGSRVTLIQG
jgi:DNA-binding transcriptional regulator YiaG